MRKERTIITLGLLIKHLFYSSQTIDVIFSVKENKGRRQSGVPGVRELPLKSGLPLSSFS